MKKNVGKADSIIRIALGLAIGIWGIAAGNWLGLIGVILLITALAGFCPIFSIFGISSCKIRD